MSHTTALRIYIGSYFVISVAGYALAAWSDRFAKIWFFPLGIGRQRPNFNSEKAIFHLSNFTVLSVLNIIYASNDPLTVLSQAPSVSAPPNSTLEVAQYTVATYVLHVLCLLPFTWLYFTNTTLRFIDWVFKPEDMVDTNEILAPLGDVVHGVQEIHDKLIRPAEETRLVMETLNQALEAMTRIDPQSEESMVPLIISSDTKMVAQMFGIQATPFFLVAQRLWFDKYWKDHPDETYFGSANGGDSIEGRAIDEQLMAAINRCVPRLVENFSTLFGYGPHYTKPCQDCRPRAIRIVFSDEHELVAHAKYLHAILSAGIFSPKPSAQFPSDGILNLWISSHVGRRIHLSEWHQDSLDHETKTFFDLPDYDWRHLIISYLSNRKITDPGNLFTDSEQFELALPRNDFLAIGGKFFKPGYAQPQSVVDGQEAWRGLLGRLPIILMALNYKYVLPFDDLVKVLSEQSSDRASEFENRLHQFQLGRPVSGFRGQ